MVRSCASGVCTGGRAQSSGWSDQVFGIDMALDGADLRQRRAQHPLRRAPHLFVHLLFQAVDGRGIENAVAQQAHLQLGQRVESGVPLALRF